LDLPLEGNMTLSVSSNIFYSDNSWLGSVRRKWAHNNNWVVECTVNLNSVPFLVTGLLSGVFSEPNNSGRLDLFHNSEFLQSLQGEALPCRFIDAEGPLVHLGVFA